MKKHDIPILGASGFTGKECLRLLAGHPHVGRVVAMSARQDAGRGERYAGALREPEGVPFAPDALPEFDAVFVCAPHERAAELAPVLLERVPLVVDLSAAFRLPDASLYPKHYGFEHPHPELLEGAVFGLTEWTRERLRGARLVANPGCYVTSVLLPLKALLEARVLETDADLIADCKSGVSGAGKAATATTHFASVHEDFRAYGVGKHRHEPEMRWHLGSERLYFTPHLLPIFRGILATIHVRPAPGRNADDLRAVLGERYESEPFVEVYGPRDGLPCIAEVQGTNLCAIGVTAAGDRAVVVSCLDNLIKGAAGQAVQNFNVALDLPETAGLGVPSLAPRGWR